MTAKGCGHVKKPKLIETVGLLLKGGRGGPGVPVRDGLDRGCSRGDRRPEFALRCLKGKRRAMDTLPAVSLMRERLKVPVLRGDKDSKNSNGLPNCINWGGKAKWVKGPKTPLQDTLKKEMINRKGKRPVEGSGQEETKRGFVIRDHK